ncbi:MULTISPECIES: iron transporter [unclassified Sphingomonas]|uniref:iron transporter n=1 Tax=unclassified Sphingomonas TaxID=196159 RepID=UPI00226A48FB
MTGSLPVTRRYRLAVASRVAAAVAGGYGVAALYGIALAAALPLDPADAAMAATLLALLAMPVAAMACFWVRSAAYAWGMMAIAGALFAGVALAAGWRP